MSRPSAERPERRVLVIVRGRVQGVGFRWFVREAAQGLGVAGHARNRPDGTVEIAAAGDAHAIETLLDRIRQGPEGSAVADVEVAELDSDEPLARPFAIVR